MREGQTNTISNPEGYNSTIAHRIRGCEVCRADQQHEIHRKLCLNPPVVSPQPELGAMLSAIKFRANKQNRK
ncbi:hypothetical protein ASPWEDRAFT_312020 [Aspergillus wentii DTO 134E9]|uniref:Uncharacterized protein n=1 Tax=Aspergillus wentii DTO 134E9 TaxID=1073089 RepID=A0A1L9RTA8_ASPWE|nr:uncharacterized protein ASPWEDRAFT_312020 [Aspergillus wentii DTO 134E9]OJJ38160.1 hypothetical protein ASPWEDRAFT_312020 [Aspergillus wentii DTO 134E9]